MPKLIFILYFPSLVQ